MIEALLVSLALSCGAFEPPYPTPFVQTALSVYRELGNREIVVPKDRPLVSLYGSDRPTLPTKPVERFSEGIAYDVWADPIYDSDCFSDFVDSVLLDDRSWPGLRRVAEDEVPQFWVTLTAPGGACGSYKNPRASCAWNNGDGTGIVTINSLRWVRGYGYKDDRTKIINHEVGHLLGFGHYECSAMGSRPWQPAAGYPAFESQWDDCGVVEAWPTDVEQAAAELVYTERWLWGGEGPWNGKPFVSQFLVSNADRSAD